MTTRAKAHGWLVAVRSSLMQPLFLFLLSLFAVQSVGAATDPASDPTYSSARLAEANGDFSGAIELYRQYLTEQPDAKGTSGVMTRVSVLQEAVRHNDSGETLKLYLEALDARERREIGLASEKLGQILSQAPGSYLSDDALYLQGYIAMMDGFKYEEAHALFHRLRREHPDSTYLDTATYSEAISLEQLGNTEAAKQVFEILRERHTEFSLSLFGVRWPKSTYLSRYWFDRADNRLNMIKARHSNAARVVAHKGSRDPAHAGYSSVVDVQVEGRRIRLLLRESGVTNTTNLDSEGELTLALSEAKFYSGVVEHDPNSWARVMIRGNEIQGIVDTGGERIDLASSSMIGTLDYYRPVNQKTLDIEAHRLQDYVMHPPPDPDARHVVPPTSMFQNNSPFPTEGDEPQLGAATSGVDRLVRMDVYVDSQYNDYYGGNGLLQAMSALNVADGIYRGHFGLALEIGNATVFTDRHNDPMNVGAVTLETTLRKFRDLRLTNGTSSGDIGLTYLFSGNKNTDEAIGLAWIGAVCRNDGFDVGVTTPSSYADLLVTHELGHSLGALHDTDTPCSAERNKLMWPRISGTTNQQFSNCSRTSVSAGVNKTCLLDTIDLSLDVQPLGAAGFTAIVTNNDFKSTAHGANLVVESAAIDLNVLPPQCAENSVGEVVCGLQQLSPGDSAAVDFTVRTAGGQGSLLARIAAGAYHDVITENDQAQLLIDPETGQLGGWQHTIAEDAPLGQGDSGGNNNQDDPSGQTDTDALGTGAGSSTGGGGGASDWWLLFSALVSGVMLRSQVPPPAMH